MFALKLYFELNNLTNFIIEKKIIINNQNSHFDKYQIIFIYKMRNPYIIFCICFNLNGEQIASNTEKHIAFPLEVRTRKNNGTVKLMQYNTKILKKWISVNCITMQ